MQITIDTKNDTHDDMRAAAAFLLHIVGDLNDDDALAEHTHGAGLSGVETTAPKAPSVAPPPPPAMPVTTAVAAGAAITSMTIPTPPTAPVSVVSAFMPPPPPIVPADSTGDAEPDYSDHSNVLSFPVPPPPPPPSVLSVGTAAPIPPAPPATTVAGVSTVVSVEVDSAGMPYDARIHQKGKGKKKDLTWKLIKGIDPAVVAAVTAELAASKGAVAPVSLPQGQGSVPVPPVPNGAAATSVPTPPVAPPVPVPPVATVGAISPYRALIERITAATKEGKITPARVNELCQSNGVPNLMQLNNMPDKIDIVGTMIDAAIAGLA